MDNNFNVIADPDNREFATMPAGQQRDEAIKQVSYDGRFGMLVGCNGPEALPYLYAMQMELSEWMLKVSREIAVFEAQRKRQEEGANL